MSIFRFSSQLFSSFLMLLFLLFRTFWWWENLLYLEVATWTWLGQFSFYLHPKHHSQGPVKCTSSSFHQTCSLCCPWLHQGHRTPSLRLEADGEQHCGHGKLDKGRVARLVPIGRALPGCHQSQGTGLVGRGWQSDLLVPFDTAFLAFPVFCSDMGLVRGRSPSLPSL